jgi:hypothetical protein
MLYLLRLKVELQSSVGIGMILMPRVTNLREQLASTDSAASLINYVFYIVALIGVILSFFVYVNESF